MNDLTPEENQSLEALTKEMNDELLSLPKSARTVQALGDAINKVLDQAIAHRVLVRPEPVIENPYMVGPYSKGELIRYRHKWCLPCSINKKYSFASLRIAKVWIKKNCGLVIVDFTAYLPGAIRSIEITGTIKI